MYSWIKNHIIETLSFTIIKINLQTTTIKLNITTFKSEINSWEMHNCSKYYMTENDIFASQIIKHEVVVRVRSQELKVT